MAEQDQDRESTEQVPKDGSGDTSAGTRPESRPQQTPLKWDAFMATIKARPIDVGLWTTRLVTILCGVFYLVQWPLFGNEGSFYYKALTAGAATSALRLHQRLPRISFTWAFFTELVREDSCHYLLYSLIFLYCAPMTMALVPILLFAMLHFASFSLTLLDALGRNSAWIGRVLISVIEFQTMNILKFAAGAEILVFVFTIVYTCIGRASLLTPFMYYRFLTFRYASRRNRYTRDMFRELRIFFDRLAAHPKAPPTIGNIIRKAIALISRFAPPEQVVQQPAN